MNMEKEIEQTLKYSPLGQINPFSNDGTISDFIGRFCNPQEISPLTLQSFFLNSQNFPIPGGIQFPPYPGQFGSDQEFSFLESQTTTQETNKSSLLDQDSLDRAQTTKSNSRKRKSIPTVTGNNKESPASSSLTASNSKISGENVGSKAGKRSKQDEAGSSKNRTEKCDSNGDDKDCSKPPEPAKDYIHVRARRGQATDSHSLAERARREKISERMTLLQDLVPGCNRITGKAVMLDEIINYVQSLQSQVEFLSMKLATINPRMQFNANTALSTEMIQPSGHDSLSKNMARFSDRQFHSSEGFVQAETLGFWENDLQSIVQMGFGEVQQHRNNNNCSEPTLQMKLDP